MTEIAAAAAANSLDDVAERDRLLARERYLLWRRRLLPIAAITGLLLAWELSVHYFDIKDYVAPAPSSVAAFIWANLPGISQGGFEPGLLLRNLAPTALEAVLGFCIGNLAAIAVAIVFVYRRTAEEAFFPLAVMINTIPIVAIAPILVLLLGADLAPKVAIAGVVCFLPTLVNFTRGMRNVTAQQVELMRVLSASPREVFIRLRFKNALPFLFVALKIASTTAVIGALLGEWIGSTEGIGALIIQATYAMDSRLLYAAIVVASAFSSLCFFAVSFVEKRALRWKVERHA